MNILAQISALIYFAGDASAGSAANDAPLFFQQTVFSPILHPDSASDNTLFFTPYVAMLLATFLPVGWAQACLNVWVLATLGVLLESRLGYLPFIAVALLSGGTGATLDLLWLEQSSSIDYFAGFAGIAGLLGCFLGYCLRNPVFSRPSNVQFANAALIAVASVVLSAQDLLRSEAASGPGENISLLASHVVPVLVAAAAGGWLSYNMGPKFEATSELVIPDGSMTVPDNAKEMMVVVDQTTAGKRTSTAAGFVAALGLATLLLLGTAPQPLLPL